MGYYRVEPYGRSRGDWVSFMIRTETDADHATRLFRLNYDRIRGVSMDALSERVKAVIGRSDASY